MRMVASHLQFYSGFHTRGPLQGTGKLQLTRRWKPLLLPLESMLSARICLPLPSQEARNNVKSSHHSSYTSCFTILLLDTIFTVLFVCSYMFVFCCYQYSSVSDLTYLCKYQFYVIGVIWWDTCTWNPLLMTAKKWSQVELCFLIRSPPCEAWHGAIHLSHSITT